MEPGVKPQPPLILGHYEPERTHLEASERIQVTNKNVIGDQ